VRDYGVFAPDILEVIEMTDIMSRREFVGTVAAGMLAKNAHAQKPSNAEPKRGMRVGLDMDKQPSSVQRNGPIALLDYVKANGFDGAYFRLMLDLSPKLDPGELKEIKAHADSLGLFLGAGVGWMNPYNTPERPDIRRFGDGDYRLAIEKMLKAARLIDNTELWAVSAHSVHGDPYYVAYDRFRTDVSWGDELLAMTKFISSLAPILRDLQLRINLETHGDETSFEAIRLIEEIGADVVGITLDPGNLPLQGDVPLDATRRMAPFINIVQPKDGIMYRSPQGLGQQLRTVGEGILDWDAALAELGKYHPNLIFCFESYRAENLLLWSTSKYRGYYPEMTESDVKQFERFADEFQQKVKRNEVLGIEEYRKLSFGDADRLADYQKGASHVRSIIKARGLG
jgi:sugar phosphate isomerase/epimerase